MTQKEIVRKINPLVIEQIREDLKNDGVSFYTVDDVPEVFIDKDLIHPEVLNKCSLVSVAASGCPGEGRNYMFIAGCRVDSDNGNIVTDLDPIIMVADLELGSPAASGIAVLHGDYEGRTEIEDITFKELNIAIPALRQSIKTSKKSFNEAPVRFSNTMHHVAKIYRRKIG